MRPIQLVTRMGAVMLVLGAMVAPASAFDPTQNPQNDWPTYGGSFNNERYSLLNQITGRNVQKLRVKWTFTVPDAGASGFSLENTPIVVRGNDAGLSAYDAVMFVTSPLDRVFALDASAGTTLWQYDVPLRSPLKLCALPERELLARDPVDELWPAGLSCPARLLNDHRARKSGRARVRAGRSSPPWHSSLEARAVADLTR